MLASYYCGFKTFNIDICLYKIYDNSVKLRQFLDADGIDRLKIIFSEHKGHFLHEIINGNESFHPFIGFNLLVKILDTIISKLLNSQAKYH